MFTQFTRVDPKLKMEIVFLFLRYWGFYHNWDMRNAFVFDGRQWAWSERISAKVEGSINVAIFFIGASGTSFLGGVFVLPIGNSTCSTTHVV